MRYNFTPRLGSTRFGYCTVKLTVVLCDNDPLVPVMVIMYVPAGVP